ncbi:hypothetical protein A2U01_0036196 [Trifolium medium]|uniref:Uncharacterized protein n=1 Tax=Trifolium medium TaxID=97028 RepID=A0A392P6H0_9FABA|nr:hypothetical protein [Trifolium medium]MCI15061.1 hypothetical protein [Trifolium medium]
MMKKIFYYLKQMTVSATSASVFLFEALLASDSALNQLSYSLIRTAENESSYFDQLYRNSNYYFF